MDQDVRELLVGMKAELSQGWTQGQLRDKNGVCLFGALISAGFCPLVRKKDGGVAVNGRQDERNRWTRVILNNSPELQASNLIAQEVGVSWNNLALWNDDSDRTVDDIVGAIDRILLRGGRMKKNARKRLQRKRELVLS